MFFFATFASALRSLRLEKNLTAKSAKVSQRTQKGIKFQLLIRI
jgi:hypothetical protein